MQRGNGRLRDAVVVFGSSGMLGSQIILELQRRGGSVGEVVAFDKNEFDVSRTETGEIVSMLSSLGLQSESYVVNCVGVTKNRINSVQLGGRLAAISANTLWPIRLAEAAEILNLKVIQPATDCVFSGIRGNYDEADRHDPTDLYGTTKSLGEVNSDAVMHIRSSFIGRQVPNKPRMFFEWISNIETGARVNGFKNHLWNGVTVNLLAQIFSGLIERRIFYPGVTHLVPASSVSKLTLIELVLEYVGRTDVQVIPTNDKSAVNRLLTTKYPDRNARLFSLAGYTEVPTLKQILEVSGI